MGTLRLGCLKDMESLGAKNQAAWLGEKGKEAEFEWRLHPPPEGLRSVGKDSGSADFPWAPS